MYEFLYKRNFEENKLKEDQIDELLAVVYHYADVMEKWKNIQFVSQKEELEMMNKKMNANHIVKNRRKENRRKMDERTEMRDKLNKKIDKFDESIVNNHR